jgi:hypothetical protein
MPGDQRRKINQTNTLKEQENASKSKGKSTTRSKPKAPGGGVQLNILDMLDRKMAEQMAGPVVETIVSAENIQEEEEERISPQAETAVVVEQHEQEANGTEEEHEEAEAGEEEVEEMAIDVDVR